MLNLGPLVLLVVIAAIVYAVAHVVRSRPATASVAPPDAEADAPIGAGRSPRGAESAVPKVRGQLAGDLARWVDAELLSEEQSLAILAYERSRAAPRAAVRAGSPPHRVPAVAEALGYLGGILAIIGLVLLVARYWPDMTTFGKLALSATGALGLLGAGAVVPERADPAFARLRGFVWLASTASSALFVGVLTHDGLGVTKRASIVLACAGLVALQSGILWRGRERPLQQLAFLAGVVVTSGAAVAEVGRAGPVGLTVWTVGVVCLAAGLKRRTPLPLLTEAAGAATVIVGAVMTVWGWQAFGLVFAAATALALLALAGVPGLAPTRADQRLCAIFGGAALLEAGPSAVGYFAGDAALATGATVWVVGSVLLLLGAERRVRLPVVVEAAGAVAILAGSALTGIQWRGFAPVFGIITALGLVALGMLPGQVLLSVFGSVGLLINVPWAIGWFFPGEGRAPLLILISGALILAVAVLLTRERGRFRRELARPRDKRLPPRHASG